MTATHSIAPTLLVAIDISKHRHEVLIGISGKARRRRLTVMNTLEDFQRLSVALASYELPVRIGFEATGNYHRPLAHHLGQAGFDLKLVSSVGLAWTREALHNSWDKNDPKDAQVILHMLEIGAVQFFHDPLPLEHDVDAPVSEATALGGHRLHRCPSFTVVRALAPIPDA